MVNGTREKNKLLSKAKALLFPIQWDEPFGIVLLEAASSGTPVIAFNRGSVPEIVKNGVNGFVVDNEKEMIEAMGKVDQIDRRKCRSFVEKNFNLDMMIKNYESLYKELL